MKPLNILFAGAVASYMFGVSAASAAIIQVTDVGTVISGTDAQGASIAGDIYQAVFNIDTTQGYWIGGEDYFPYRGPENYGSAVHNSGSSVAVTGTLAVGGSTYALDGSTSGEDAYSAELHTGSTELYQDVSSPAGSLSVTDYYNVAPAPFQPGFSDPLLSPMSLHSSSTYSGPLGSFAIIGGPSGSLSLSSFDYRVVSPAGSPSILIPQFPSAAPEPSTWMLMIIGLSMVGAMLRRVGVRTALQGG